MKESRELVKGTFSGLPFIKTISVMQNSFLNVVQSETFDYLPRVNAINLTSNSIKEIQPNAFGSLGALTVLDLSYNYLETVHPHAFGSLPHLTDLNLSYNNLTILPGEDILRLSRYSLKQVSLEGNPWNCSCDMFWIVLLNSSIFAGSQAVCHYPSELHGTPLQHLREKDFQHCCTVAIVKIIPYIYPLIALMVISMCSSGSIQVLLKIYNHYRSHKVIGHIKLNLKELLAPSIYSGILNDGRTAAIKVSRLHAQRSREL